MTSQTIRRTIDIAAPVSRVWQALTDARQFGTWFRVALEGDFTVGETIYGQTTYPGYEHLRFEAIVESMTPESNFVFLWHPYAVDTDVDYSSEPNTRVEFQLEPLPNGTRLTVEESGFENLPEHRRDLAFRMNDGGWAEQLNNIQGYVQR